MTPKDYNWSKDPKRLLALLESGIAVIYRHGSGNLRELRAQDGRIDLNQNTRFSPQWISIAEFIDFFINRMGHSFVDPCPPSEPEAITEIEAPEEVVGIYVTQEQLDGMKTVVSKHAPQPESEVGNG